MQIVSVALPIPLAQTFDYIIPNNLFPVVGGRVRVQFGNNQKIGIVIAIKENSLINLNKLKFLKDVLDTSSLFSDSIWRLLIWSIDYYHYPVGKIIFHAIPTYLRKGKKADIVTLFKCFATKKGLNTKIDKLCSSPKQQKALSALLRGTIYSYQLRELHIKENTLKSLRTKGLCDIHNTKKIDWRLTFSVNCKKIIFNKEQAIAVSSIIKNDEKFITWLLAGVTGSGKTEIYLKVLENILSKGKQALVLVPEISLTTQTIERFRKRFIAPIDVLHSGLNNSERLEVWIKARCGDSAIIIGTRSAIFTPFALLGMIIIDEEHDSSYKQNFGWCYHARDLAIFRAREENIPIILGTATPTLETLYNVKKKKYKQLTLNKRVGIGASTVIKKILDMKGKRLTNGLLSILLKKISEHIEDDNQVMLFINRRGFAPVLLCHECGWIAECNRCDHYYTLHQYHRNISCHYCNKKYSIPYQCIKCGSTQLLPVGLGTEQLESTISKKFPNVPVTRIDRDTTLYKGSFEKYILKVKSGGARILIGTQMLAKGHHFNDVTLVVLLDVDGALFSGDFRSYERFAQLYTNVSGSVLYGKNCEVLLQTYHAEHPLLQSLLHKNYIELAKELLEERRKAKLPPFYSNILFRAEDYDNNKAMLFINELRNLLTVNNLFEENILIIGPIPSLQPKRCGRFRWQLLLSSNYSRIKLHNLVSNILKKVIILSKIYKVKWSLDVDPLLL